MMVIGAAFAKARGGLRKRIFILVLQEIGVMWNLMIRPKVGALAVGAALALAVAPTNAQRVLPNSSTLVNPAFRVTPNLTLQQFAHNNAVMAATISQYPAWAFGYNPYPSPVVNPYGVNPYAGYGSAYSPYGGAGTLSTTSMYGGYDPAGSYGSPYSPYYDPYGGSVLRGYADILGAQGKFAVNVEQSKGMREQRRQAEIDTRRKLFEEWQYERANTPSLEDLREQDRKMARRRALNDPPVTEILSGTALNTLLDHLKIVQGMGARGQNIAIDDETLKKVNVTSGAGGNVGLLKNDGYLNWPLPLKGDEFNEERGAIDKALPKLVQQASASGRVDAGTLTETKKSLEALHEKLAKNVGEIGTSQYIESKRYLNFLNDAMRVLSNSDVEKYFNQTFTAKGKTAGELVKYMGDKGLKFAAATPGDEAAYRALHQALAVYDVSLSQAVAEK
jgi:hypothetical protein